MRFCLFNLFRKSAIQAPINTDQNQFSSVTFVYFEMEIETWQKILKIPCHF
jgi:hypothetical protein